MSRVVSITDSAVVFPSGYLDDHAYASISNVERAYTDATSTSYAQVNLTTGTSAETYMWFTFSVPSIPSGATINSVTCQAKIYISTTNQNRVATRTAQIYSGTTAKGNATTVSNSTTAFTMSVGNWTLSELQDIRLRLYAKRGSSNTTSNYYFRVYGATFTINYSINTTAYTIIATSTVSGMSASPAAQELYAGQDAVVTINGPNFNGIEVTDNDVDVTSSLVQHSSQPGSYTNTFIPSSFDSTNSVYNTTAGDSGDGIYSTNYIENGLTDHNSTTRCALYAVQGSGAVSYMYYNFDCSSIPSNATITSVSCQFKGGTQGSSYYSSYVAQLTTGTTLKGSSTSVTGSNSSPTTVTINGGTSWTRAELNNIKIKFTVTRGSSNTTTDSTWSFFGATLTVNYTISPENPYYWTYTILNLADDHEVIISESGPFIPPDEDPQYNYYSLTISSINATTDPGGGTTRLQEGSNQIVTITPTDPLLTLALDNGTDIMGQLVSHTASNTYTVTTKVSGATYGFNLNSNTGYYVSTNNGQSKSASVARLNMDFETACVVTIQYINYAEEDYDYGMFGKLDTTVATDGLTAGSGSSSPSDSTSNYQLAMCSNSSSAQTITYTVPAGTHYIDIKYGKDDASDSNNDSLQWKVLSIAAEETTGYYTYSLSNIQQKHSLIFIFGNVSYYFITSSTDTGARIYPDGQTVKLAGDDYSLRIVPDSVDAAVELTDNNVSQTSALVREDGEDKQGNPVVNYVYTLSNVAAAHTIIVSIGGASPIFYVKEDGDWEAISVSKVFKKINGSWVEQSDLTTVFDATKNYIKEEVPVSGYTATVSGANGGNVTYNGNTYATGTSFTYSAGETASIGVSSRSNCYVYVDGTQVATSYNGVLAYSYTLPAHSILITYENTNTATVTVYITTA